MVLDVLNDDMWLSGLSYFIVVFGVNCVIVVGVIFWLMVLCGGGWVVCVCFVFFGFVGFVVLVMLELSVICVVVMVVVGMFMVLLG